MKKIIFIVAMSVHFVCGDKIEVDGVALFSSVLRDGVFLAKDFKISKIEDGMKVQSGPKSIKVETTLKIIEDFTSSENGEALSLLLSDGANRRKYELHILVKGEKKSVVRFRDYEFLHDFDWIMEIVAISREGNFLLLKGAKLNEAEQGKVERRVSHKWVIMNVGKKGASVEVGDDPFSEWSKYLDK